MMTTKTNNVRGESSKSTSTTRMKMSTDLIHPVSSTKQTTATKGTMNKQTNHGALLSSSSSPRTKRNILLSRHRSKTTTTGMMGNNDSSSPPFVPFPASLEFEPDDNNNEEIIATEEETKVVVEQEDKCSVTDLEHELRQSLSPTEWMSFNMKHSVAGRMLLSNSSNNRRHQSLLLFRSTSSRSTAATTENSNKLHRSEPMINFTYHGSTRSSSSNHHNDEPHNHHSHRRALVLPHSCRHLFSKRSHSLREVDEDQECSSRSQVTPTSTFFDHNIKHTKSQHDKQLHKSFNDLLNDPTCRKDDSSSSSSNDEELSDNDDDNLEQALYETRQHNLERNSPNGPSCRQIIYSCKKTSSYSSSSRHRHVDTSSSLHAT